MPVVAVLVLLLFGEVSVRAQANTPPAGTTTNRVLADPRDTSSAVPVPALAPAINPEGSFWQGNNRTILLTGAVLLGQSLLIAGLLIQGRRRRKAEQELRDRQDDLFKSQSRYKLATAAGSVGVWDWNFESNELFVDPGLKAILGFEDEEISSRPDDWGSRVYPDDLPLAAAAIKACMDGQSDTYEIEHRMLHKDGSLKWMLSRGTALRAENGSMRRLVGTKVDITERKQAEDVIHESQAILDASHREIQDLAGRLIASQELERTRLARDLHDDLSQQIAGLSIAQSALKRRLNEIPGARDLGLEMSELQQRTIGLADNIRRLSHDLHPHVLQRAGLVAALEAHCAELEQQQRLAVTFVAEGEFESTSAAVALCLYRIAQESLRNVITHAQASHVEVRLVRDAGHVDLAVTDDGKGFDVAEARRQSDGLGLVSMGERARLVGGTMSLFTQVNKGTRLRVLVPANEKALESQPA